MNTTGIALLKILYAVWFIFNNFQNFAISYCLMKVFLSI